MNRPACLWMRRIDVCVRTSTDESILLVSVKAHVGRGWFAPIGGAGSQAFAERGAKKPSCVGDPSLQQPSSKQTIVQIHGPLILKPPHPIKHRPNDRL